MTSPRTLWTLVGRADERAHLDRLMRRRRGAVLISGPVGIGKTSLALEAVRSTEAHRLVVVRATSGLSHTPLAALVPLLEHLGIAAGIRDDLRAVVTELLRSVGELGDPMVVVIDDAPRLDPMSAEVVRQLLDHRSVCAVMTARDGEPLAPSLDHLVDEGLIETIVVGPLDIDGVTAMARSLLGAPLVGASAGTLAAASGGNPLYLRELLAGSIAAAAFTAVPGGLELTAAVPSTRLVDVVAARFGDVDDRQREIVEELAVAQPLPLAGLAAVAGRGEALEALEAVGLAVVDGDEVRLGHPIHGEVLRASMPPLRRRSRLAAAIELLRRDERPESDFRAACLAIEGDLPFDAVAVADAALRALGLLDHRLALRLAERSITDGNDFVGHLVTGAASSALGEGEKARVALEVAGRLAVGDEQRARAAQQLGMHLAVRSQRPVDALESAEAVLAGLTDDRWATFLAADVAKWRLMAGQQVDAPPESGDGSIVDVGVLDGGPSPEDVAALVNQQMIVALVSVMAGATDDADRAIELALPLAIAHPEALPNARDLLQLSRFLSTTFRAEVVEATSYAEEQLIAARSQRPDAVGMWSYALGVTSMYRGRVSAAAVYAASAVEQLAWRDFTGLGPSASALQAVVLAQQGRTADAASMLRSLSAGDLDDPKVALLAAQAELWLAVADGDPRDAVADLAETAERALSLQHGCLAALAVHDAVRLGHPEAVLGPLRSASTAGAVLSQVIAAHAEAAAVGDAAALSRVAERLATTGLSIAAADAAAQAAAVHRRRGRSEAARRASLRSSVLAGDCDGPRGVVADDADVALTPREHQVARLASQRWRSREIAEQLSISTRTVDNHLATIYRKLGVAGRSEMASVLAEAGVVDPAAP